MSTRGASVLSGLARGLEGGLRGYLAVKQMRDKEAMERGRLQAIAQSGDSPNIVEFGDTVNLPDGVTSRPPASVLGSPRDYSQMDLGELALLATSVEQKRKAAAVAREREKEIFEREKDMRPVTLPEIRLGDRPAAREDISEIVREAINRSRSKEGFSPLSPDEATSLVPDQPGGYGSIKGKTLAPEMTVPRVGLQDAQSIRGKMVGAAFAPKKKTEDPKAPTTRTYESNGKKITEEWDPATGSWRRVGENKIVRGAEKRGLGDANESDFLAYLSLAQNNALKTMKFNEPSQLSILMAIANNPEQAGVLMGQLERSMTPEQQQKYQAAVTFYIETSAPDAVVEAYHTRIGRTSASALSKPEPDPNDPLGFFNSRR